MVRPIVVKNVKNLLDIIGSLFNKYHMTQKDFAGLFRAIMDVCNPNLPKNYLDAMKFLLLEIKIEKIFEEVATKKLKKKNNIV